jgi:hypothetical protein
MKLKRPRQVYDLIEVVWDDAAELEQGWTDELATPEMHLCLSVGFLVKETPDHIVLALDVDPNGLHNGRGQIPRGMVKKMKVLRKKDETKVANENPAARHRDSA